MLHAVEDRRAPGPDSGLLVAEQQQALHEALGKVSSAKARRALQLRLVKGLSYAAVSKETGVPLGTVANWVHKLRRSLRDQERRAA
jgi:RNA polymerase sigma factor (sigma-70 family)